jgi:hypothetical protein
MKTSAFITFFSLSAIVALVSQAAPILDVSPVHKRNNPWDSAPSDSPQDLNWGKRNDPWDSAPAIQPQ